MRELGQRIHEATVPMKIACLIALLTGLQFASAADAPENPRIELLEAEKEVLQAQNIFLQAQVMLIRAEQKLEAVKKAQEKPKPDAKKEK